MAPVPFLEIGNLESWPTARSLALPLPFLQPSCWMDMSQPEPTGPRPIRSHGPLPPFPHPRAVFCSHAVYFCDGGAFLVSPTHNLLTTARSPVDVACVLSVSLVVCTASLLVSPCDAPGHWSLSLWLPLVDDSPPIPPPSTALSLPETLDSGEMGDRPPPVYCLAPQPLHLPVPTRVHLPPFP